MSDANGDRPARLAADRVVWALRRAELAVQARKERALRPLGMAAAHYTFLASLSADEGLTGAELSRRLGVTPQAVASLVARLEQKGLIERRAHARHGHVQELHLTPSGVEALVEADLVIGLVEDEVTALVGTDNRDKLRSQLELIAMELGNS